jgi:hypothetical protein
LFDQHKDPSASIIKLIRPARWRSLARREHSALV